MENRANPRNAATRIFYTSDISKQEISRMDSLVRKLNKLPEFREFVDLHLKMKVKKMMVIDI